MKKVQGVTILECVLYISLSTVAFFMLSTFVLSLTTSLKTILSTAQVHSLHYSALESLHRSLRQASPDIRTWHVLSQHSITWQNGSTVISWYQKGTRFMHSYKKGVTATQYRVIAENIQDVVFDIEKSDIQVLSIACTLISSECICKRKYVYKIGIIHS